jgi:ThiF family protein
MTVTLTMTAAQRKQLHSHLFPGDGCEAVAILLCARRAGERVHRLLVRKIVPVPYGDCAIRRPDLVQWSTDLLPSIIEEANRQGWSVVKIHGHANDYRAFSPADDDSDKELFPSVAGWFDADVPHGSVVLLEDGHLFGRTVSPDGVFSPMERIMVVGDDVQIGFDNGGAVLPLETFTDRHARAFGAATTRLLRRLTVAVVGVSGTGSPLIEMLFRLGVGRLLLIDPDFVNEENLNRIV